MYVLEEMWFSPLSPIGISSPKSEEYTQALHYAVESQQKILELLPSELKMPLLHMKRIKSNYKNLPKSGLLYKDSAWVRKLCWTLSKTERNKKSLPSFEGRQKTVEISGIEPLTA